MFLSTLFTGPGTIQLVTILKFKGKLFEMVQNTKADMTTQRKHFQNCFRSWQEK